VISFAFMRFLIVGAGAIGTAMGGYLGDAGFDVVLVTRPAHAYTRSLLQATPELSVTT